jgi:hypothetical protein
VNDWVPASRRTLRYVGVASLLWVVGATTGLVSQRINDFNDIVSDVSLLAMVVLSVAVAGWSAMQCRRGSWLRRGWLLTTAGLGVAFASVAYMVVRTWISPQYLFNGAVPGVTAGFMIGGFGYAVAGFSIGKKRGRFRPFLQAAVLSAAVYLVMMGALLAPGPTMPFSVGPRDVIAAWRLAIDCGLLLFPAVYATLAQLRLPTGHRARGWMWASAGALVLAMGDVGAPLVSLGDQQFYPVMLWCLGVILISASASLTADFERADRGLGDSRAWRLRAEPTVEAH